MRVLVTRARDDAKRTATRLAAAGHEAVCGPVIEIAATGVTLPDASFDAVLATSVHALTGIARLPHALGGTAWLVVGQRLADMLAARGLGPAEIVARDAAGMLGEIDARYPEPFRFLYLAGRDRKPDLEQGLMRRGHDLTIVETYEAKPVGFDPSVVASLRGGTLDAVLHFSRRSAELFSARVHEAGLEEQVRELRHIAISPDAATPLLAQGWRAETADTPDEETMLALLS